MKISENKPLPLYYIRPNSSWIQKFHSCNYNFCDFYGVPCTNYWPSNSYPANLGDRDSCEPMQVFQGLSRGMQEFPCVVPFQI